MKQICNSTKVSFSPAELKVVEQLARGLSEKEIADVLHISVYTVKNHLRNIRERNHIQKNTEIIILYASTLSKKRVFTKRSEDPWILYTLYTSERLRLLTNSCVTT